MQQPRPSAKCAPQHINKKLASGVHQVMLSTALERTGYGTGLMVTHKAARINGMLCLPAGGALI
eukprot:3221116-Rhodomonas_salina.1